MAPSSTRRHGVAFALPAPSLRPGLSSSGAPIARSSLGRCPFGRDPRAFARPRWLPRAARAR
eukprot:15393411-Alexandrium_andersonii.AAC.1